MEIKLNTKIPYTFIGEKHVKNMGQEVTLSIKFYKEYTLEEIYITFYYVYETEYLYYGVRDKGDCSFIKKELCWHGFKEGSTKEIWEDIDSDGKKYEFKIESTKFEKEVIEEVERIIKEQDYKIINKKTLKFDDVMDLSEASKKYNININTLKSACQQGLNGLIEDVDYKKSGRVWIITKDALKKFQHE